MKFGYTILTILLLVVVSALPFRRGHGEGFVEGVNLPGSCVVVAAREYARGFRDGVNEIKR
jgi:hypothetical protein